MLKTTRGDRSTAVRHGITVYDGCTATTCGQRIAAGMCHHTRWLEREWLCGSSCGSFRTCEHTAVHRGGQHRHSLSLLHGTVDVHNSRGRKEATRLRLRAGIAMTSRLDNERCSGRCAPPRAPCASRNRVLIPWAFIAIDRFGICRRITLCCGADRVKRSNPRRAMPRRGLRIGAAARCAVARPSPRVVGSFTWKRTRVY